MPSTEFTNQPDTQIEELYPLLNAQRKAFLDEGIVSFETRIDRLDRLDKLLRENMNALITAIQADFGHRSGHQTKITDFYGTFEVIKHQKKHLKKWMRIEKRGAPFPLNLLGAKAEIYYQPKGVVGNITTWNFPIFVGCSPLAGILAAGNRCMVKLTEVTPRSSALMKQLFSQYFDPTEVVGITGGPEIGAAFSALPLDHIIFTGATSVARHILQAAAPNLTPVTLELGGKSPAIIGRDADMGESVLRLFTGKALNMGQVCISPDYVFVESSRLESFIATATAQFSQMFPTIIHNEHYSSVINQRHFERLRSYISDAQSKGGDIRIINPANEDFDEQIGTHKLPMTLVINPSDDMLVMQEEIFGPIISIKSYQNIDEVIAYINRGARPLALYYFGDDTVEQEQVLGRTTSGGACINDTIAQAGIEDIPFGGIGPSGMGSYHGIEGFKTFSHAKAVFKQSKINIMKFTAMIPPYSDKTDKSLDFMLKK